jgi:hypothetical protein
LATASFVALLLYWQQSQSRSDAQPSTKLLILSVLAALGASYSLASGNLLWPLLVAAALYLRLRMQAVLSLAIAGIISIALYVFHYATPERHADPLASLRAPLMLLKYCGVYLFNSWSHQNMRLWEVAALIALAIIVALLMRAMPNIRAFQPLAIQLVLTLLFCMGTALITATGRANFGVEQARASRYQTVALLFWCCFGLLLLGSAYFAPPRMRYAFLVAQVCLLLIVIRGALLVKGPLEEAREHAFQQNTVAAAVLTGVHDREIISKLGAPETDAVLNAVSYLRANRLSAFSETPAAELGKPLSTLFPVAPAGSCVGFLKAGKPIEDQTGPRMRLAGWVWDTRHHEPASGIVVTSDGIVTGIGAAGGSLPEARDLYPEAGSSHIGFFAFLPKPRPESIVAVYAILGGNHPTACYFDGWRQQ